MKRIRISATVSRMYDDPGDGRDRTFGLSIAYDIKEVDIVDALMESRELHMKLEAEADRQVKILSENK